MGRRARVRSSGQKGKDGKRPRGFHRGRAQGEINERTMVTTIEPAYARADADRDENAARAARERADREDWRGLLEQLDRAAPHVPGRVPVL